jgi:hypothetical protein
LRTPEEDLYSRLTAAEKVKETAPVMGGTVERELAKTDSDFRTPLTLRNLFTHHDAHPIVLDFALIKAFQFDWLIWEPETIWASILDMFKSNVSEHNRAKIMAVQTMHVSHAPWMMWQVFEKVVQALNNNVPRFDVMQAPSLEQLYAAVDIMDTLRREEFSTEVKQYMAAAVLHDDVFYVPSPLDFIQVEVSKPYYRCEDCGSTYMAAFHDGVCDNCTQKFDPEQGLSMRPKQELLEAGLGKKMALIVKYDPDPVQARWEEVRKKSEMDIELQENQVDVQVAKLIVARDYMNVRRRQLAEQLVSLRSWLGAS